MREKFHPVGIHVRKDWIYNVTPFAVLVNTGPNQPDEVVYYIPGPISQIMVSTKDIYEYFIDEEGDISREQKGRSTPQFHNP